MKGLDHFMINGWSPASLWPLADPLIGSCPDLSNLLSSSEDLSIFSSVTSTSSYCILHRSTGRTIYITIYIIILLLSHLYPEHLKIFSYDVSNVFNSYNHTEVLHKLIKENQKTLATSISLKTKINKHMI